ncbi:murein hydrolase activator EnvC family protein [Aquihabitans sp. McL0605]|uniref:murein hydrolase activator EnvC family protein n=1 Tax=Aquihabitans sp. McL0605 TaxID=3415671 RepID=UPI003CEE697A
MLLWASPAGAAAAPGAPTGRPRYQPPTSGQVVDPFRPPPQPWLPGNRGIEYATAPGSEVTAIGPGRVAFAGPVAGRLVVTVLHPDGLRSSYVGLGSIAVRSGDPIAVGQAVGRANGRLHLGVRRGDAYLDPASLWGHPVGGGRAVLVPLEPSGTRRSGGDPPQVGGRGSSPPTGVGLLARIFIRPAP